MEQDIEPVEIPARPWQNAWRDWEITPESLIFLLSVSIVFAGLLGYYS